MTDLLSIASLSPAPPSPPAQAAGSKAALSKEGKSPTALSFFMEMGKATGQALPDHSFMVELEDMIRPLGVDLTFEGEVTADTLLLSFLTKSTDQKLGALDNILPIKAVDKGTDLPSLPSLPSLIISPAAKEGAKGLGGGMIETAASSPSPILNITSSSRYSGQAMMETISLLKDVEGQKQTVSLTKDLVKNEPLTALSKAADRFISLPPPSSPSSSLGGEVSFGLGPSPLSGGHTHSVAATSAPQTVTAEIPQPFQQVAQALASRPADRVVDVRLSPPELGTVRIEIDFSQDGLVKAIVSASETDTLQLLKRNGGQLAKELTGAGFGDVDLNFTDTPSQDQPDDHGVEPQKVTYLPMGETTVSSPTSYNHTSLSLEGLDIRL
ncbi:MAG: flagellar hook-length control protein FliK [Pseudomonadota bacterium]